MHSTHGISMHMHLAGIIFLTCGKSKTKENKEILIVMGESCFRKVVYKMYKPILFWNGLSGCSNLIRVIYIVWSVAMHHNSCITYNITEALFKYCTEEQNSFIALPVKKYSHFLLGKFSK